MRSSSRPLVACLLVVALAAAACSADDRDPVTELSDAARALAASTFSYSLTLELDPAVVDRVFGPDTGMVAGIVSSFEVRGVKGDGQFSLGAAVMGLEPLSVRSYDSGRELYLRVGLAELLQAAGGGVGPLGPDTEALAALPGDSGEVLRRLLDGEWVGFVGVDPDEPDDPPDAAGDLGLQLGEVGRLGARLRARLADLESLLDGVATIDRTRDGGRARFDVVIRTEPALREVQELLAPLMGALGQGQDEADLEADLQELLAGAPQTIPGLSATVTDGDLTEVALDIGRFVSAMDEGQVDQVAPGQAVLRLTFADHGSAAVPDRPEDATTYDQQQFAQLGELLADPSLLEGALPTASPPVGGIADQQAALLVTLQLAWFDEHGSYTEDVTALLASDDRVTDLLVPGATYGACVTDGGEAFVVGASVDGDVAYYDSDLMPYDDPSDLPCEPSVDVTG